MERNMNEGWYLDDYTFSSYECEEGTYVITPLDNSKIISLYVSKSGHVHAIVKEQPYLQYRPINISIKVQRLDRAQDHYYVKMNSDFKEEDILTVAYDNEGKPIAYIYPDMECEYWKKKKNIENLRRLF